MLLGFSCEVRVGDDGGWAEKHGLGVTLRADEKVLCRVVAVGSDIP